MKKILFIIIILLASTKCFGDIYVYSNKQSNEVIFITEKDNVVISDEDKNKIEMTIFPNDIAFYDLTERYDDYKITGKKIILNTKKISDRENAKIKEKVKQDKKNEDFESAKAKLMSATWEPLTSDEVDSLH